MNKILITLALLIAASSAAAKQEKTEICHVGNKAGPEGQLYDPTCVPSDTNNFFCPDAGKISLVSVVKADSHLGNFSHYWDGQSDYLPPADAIGVGDEDVDGDYIDDGCDDYDNTPETCPCFVGLEGAPWQGLLEDFVDGCVPGGDAYDPGEDVYRGGVGGFVFYGELCAPDGPCTYDPIGVVNVGFQEYCDLSFEASCFGSTGTFNGLTRAQYAACEAGPDWPGLPSN